MAAGTTSVQDTSLEMGSLEVATGAGLSFDVSRKLAEIAEQLVTAGDVSDRSVLDAAILSHAEAVGRRAPIEPEELARADRGALPAPLRAVLVRRAGLIPGGRLRGKR